MITEAQALDALPARGWLRDYVEFAMSITDANVAYHIAAGLTVLSQSIPIEFLIPDGNIRCNFYSLIIGPSTESRKTTAVKIAQRILTNAAPDRVMAKPASEERFVDSIVENPQQLWFVHEGGSFFSPMTGGYLRPLKDRLADVYDCTPQARQKVDNRKRPKPQPNPRFSLLVAIADSYLEEHTSDDDWTSGLLARFFTLYGKKTRDYDKVGSDKGKEIQLVDRLKAYVAEGSTQTLDSMQGNGIVECLGCNEESSAMWKTWREKTREQSRVAPRNVKATIERSQDMAWKIAGLLAWDVGYARTRENWYITPDILKSALDITDLHIASAIEIGDTLSPDPKMRLERRVLQCIRSSPTPISVIFREAQVTGRDGWDVIKTLLAKRRIEQTDASDGEQGFRRIDRNGAPSPAGKVITFADLVDEPPKTDQKTIDDLFG